MGRALRDYANGKRGATLKVLVEDHAPHQMPVAYFFRSPSRMDAVDTAALELARGRILDVGAAAGAHSAPLVGRGLEVTALEILPEAIEILQGRGVGAVRRSVWSFRPRRRFDTVLALMNGTSLAGTLARLGRLLERLRELTAQDGQLLIDSTEMERPELDYQLEYQGVKGPPFPQLFVGADKLKRAATKVGWKTEVVARAGERYLARLTTSGR